MTDAGAALYGRASRPPNWVKDTVSDGWWMICSGCGQGHLVPRLKKEHYRYKPWPCRKCQKHERHVRHLNEVQERRREQAANQTAALMREKPRGELYNG